MEQKPFKKHQYTKDTINDTASLSKDCAKKEILRKCLTCGKIKNRANLIRIMKCSSTKAVLLNPDSKHFGRSAYICYNKDCVKEAVRKKKIQKYLKINIDESFYIKLESILN